MFCQYIDRNHHLNPTQRCSKPIPALLEGIYFLKIEFHLANTNMYVTESVSFILFILIVCFVSLRTCTCTFLSHSDNTWNICSPCSTLFGSWKNDNYIWKVVKRNSKFITTFISFSQKFCIVQMIFWCCFWGFYFCLFFFKWVGMGVRG